MSSLFAQKANLGGAEVMSADWKKAVAVVRRRGRVPFWLLRAAKLAERMGLIRRLDDDGWELVAKKKSGRMGRRLPIVQGAALLEQTGHRMRRHVPAGQPTGSASRSSTAGRRGMIRSRKRTSQRRLRVHR